MGRDRTNRGFPCRLEECDGGAYAKGYCRKHYNRLYKTGRVDLLEPEFNPNPDPGLDAFLASRRRRGISPGGTLMEGETMSREPRKKEVKAA